ncbi:MAG: hypothetical protein WC824_14565 [Bacteroidota bacterium]|jgi:hypothetical protein
MAANDLTVANPEVRLAIEVGVKEALKALEKAEGDPRDGATPDRTTKGLVINMTLEVDEVIVGHDTDKTPTCSIPLLPVLALLVKRLGATREATLSLLKDVMQEALDLEKDKSATERLMQEAGVIEAEQEIKEKVIGTLTRTPVKKTIKVKGVKFAVTGCAQRAV